MRNPATDDRFFNDSLYVLIPGFFATLAVTIIVSRLTDPPTDVERMFGAMSGNEEASPGEGE